MMPMRVIGMLLGIPESEQISVRDANDANLRTKPGTPLKVANADSIADGRIYADYVEWRSKNPSDDLMTTLLNVEFDDEHGVHRKLTRKEVLHYTQVVAGAGNETTGRLIGWLAKVLAEHPDQRREIEQDRSLLNRTVDETLRFEPTGPHVARWMAQDFECYGTTVPAGSAMLLLFGAANRDPRRYTDPDTLQHPSRQHLAHHFRQRCALLPGSQPRPAGGPRRAGRDPQPLARVGYRLRHSTTRVDVYRARVGEAADPAALVPLSDPTRRTIFGVGLCPPHSDNRCTAGEFVAVRRAEWRIRPPRDANDRWLHASRTGRRDLVAFSAVASRICPGIGAPARRPRRGRRRCRALARGSGCGRSRR